MGPQQLCQMEVELFYLKSGCLSGSPSSSGQPLGPHNSSDHSVNTIELDYLQIPSSSVIILPDGTATAGFSVYFSHHCDLLTTGKDLLGTFLEGLRGLQKG